MILKRLLFYPLLFISIVIFLLLAIIYVPGVPALALKMGKGAIPEEVTIGSISGALAGDLVISDVEYVQDDTRVSVAKVLLDWTPSCLLRSHLCIHQIRVDSLSLSLPESDSEKESSTEPFEMPELTDIDLPMSLNLEKFSIHDIEVTIGDQRFNLDSVSASLAVSNQISIESFRIQQGNTRIDWQAQLRPTGNYELSSNLNWLVEVSDLETLLNQPLELPIDAPIVGSLALSGDLKNLSVILDNQTSTEITGGVSLHLDSVVKPFDEQLQLNHLIGRLNDIATEISLSGSLHNWFEPEVDFTLEATDVVYPFVTENDLPLISIPASRLTLKGGLDDYQINLETAASGQDIPDVRVHFSGKGNLESLESFTLNTQLLGGEVIVQGAMGWANQIHWDTQMQVNNLNPGQFNPELEGNINLDLRTQGVFDESGPQLSADLNSLTGSFREQPLRGQGKVAYTTDAIDIDSLLIGLGVTQLTLNGQMQNEHLALNFDVNAPDLSDVLPELAGSINASGQVRGPMLTPEINSEIDGAELAFQDHRVASITGRIRADISGESASNIQLSLQDLHLANEHLETVNIQLTGIPERHDLSVLTEGELINLSAQLRGGLNLEELSYQGRLAELDIERSEIGRWIQQSPSNLHFKAPAFGIESTCLDQVEGTAQLCLSANRNNADRLQAEFSLSDLSLTILNQFLHDLQVDSNLNLTGQFSQQGTQHPQAQINLSTTAGHLITPEDQPDFDLDPIRLEANLSGDNLHAELSALFSEMDGEISANVNLQQLSSQQRLNGDLRITLNDLGMISVFAPAIQAVEGQLDGRFDLAGSLSAPVIRGHFDLQNGAAELPGQGIKLSPLQLSIRSEGEAGEQMTLQGLIGSGDGEIRLAGDFNLASMEGLLSIQGEDFEAMATEINLLISPDMQILVDDAIRVGGSVTVPYALITPPRQQAQNAIRASDDVVFIDDDAETFTERELPLITDLELILGDSVVVNAFGFNGRLLGRLRIQDDGTSATRASGNIQVESGDYRLFGQDLTIQRGSLIFSGGPIDNPGLDLRVSRTIDTVEAGARIVGTLIQPEFTLFSTPAMPDSSIMSYLILGKGPGDSSAGEQSMMLQAAMALSMQGGNTITGQLREELNLDEFGFATDDTGDSAFFIGKYLTPRLYIRYGISLLESIEVLTLSYRLTSAWKVETQSSSVGSGADFFYTRER